MRASSSLANELSGLRVDRSSALPVYAQIRQQISSVLRQMRRRGIDQFFTDNILSVHYGVSRMTARQAIGDLVREGTLYRRRGVGTFIAPPKAVETEGPIGDFFEDWVTQGHKVGVKILAFRKARAPSLVAAALHIEPGARLLYFRRLRLLNGEPVSVDDRWISPFADNLITRDELRHNSIHLVILPKLGVRIAHAHVEIEATSCSLEHAPLLKINVGDPVLIRSITPVSTQGYPLWTGSSVYRADLYKYKATVTAQ